MRIIVRIFLGQMIYMDNWKMMMYLGTPVMPDLNALIATGLYINDLSMHDFSRWECFQSAAILFLTVTSCNILYLITTSNYSTNI